MGCGSRIKAARKAAGFTQEQLAKKCGVATITIRQYESDKREPNLQQLRNIADTLNADIVYLISGQTSQEIEQGILIQAEEEAKEEFEKLQLGYQNKSYDERVSLSSALIRLFKLFAGFNPIGHQKAVERVEELTEIPRYRRQDASDQGVPTQNTPAPEPPPESTENGG